MRELSKPLNFIIGVFLVLMLITMAAAASDAGPAAAIPAEAARFHTKADTVMVVPEIPSRPERGGGGLRWSGLD